MIKMYDLKGKSVMVTGGAGFIGSHLVDGLIKERPGRIVAVDNLFLGSMGNLRDAMRSKDLVVINDDATDLEKMRQIVRSNEIDVVFNLAVVPLGTSIIKPDWTFDTNVKITRTFCELAREDEFDTLVHFSSSEVYGTLTGKMDETHQLLPHTPYAASKAACDHLVYSYYKTFGIDMTMIRPFNNYGPRQNDKSYAAVIPLTIKRILNGEPPVIHGDGEQTRDFLFVEDTVKATIDAYKSEKTRGLTMNVASGVETSVNTLVRMICGELGWEKPVVHTDPRPGDVQRHLGDATLARKIIGFRPATCLEDGIRQTVDWYREQEGKKCA